MYGRMFDGLGGCLVILAILAVVGVGTILWALYVLFSHIHFI